MSETTETREPRAQRDRSPSYPAIPLGSAIERLVTFETYFKRHPAPLNKVGLAWGMSAKGSQSDLIMAALKSFGLIEYEGPANSRQAVISEDGRTYLRAQQDAIKKEVLRRAALRPKSIAMMWGIWGSDRPPDPVCLDTLTLKHGFSDRGAPLFLKVYDATIDYAGLGESDKISPEIPGKGDLADTQEEDADAILQPPPPPPPLPHLARGKARLMEGERELTTGLLSKDASFRLIVSGDIGVKEIERLIRKLELDKEILADEPSHEAGHDPFKE